MHVMNSVLQGDEGPRGRPGSAGAPGKPASIPFEK